MVLIVPRNEKEPFEAQSAIAAGVKRLVVVSDRRVKQRLGLRGLGTRFRKSVEREEKNDDANRQETDIVYLSTKVADRILERWGRSVAELRSAATRPRPFLMRGVDIELRLELRRTEITGRNVLGIDVIWMQVGDEDRVQLALSVPSLAEVARIDQDACTVGLQEHRGMS